MKLAAIIFLFFVFIVQATAQRTISYKDSNFLYKLSVDSALSTDSVNYDNTVKSIQIFDHSGNTLIQTIVPAQNNFTTSLPDSQIFIVEDVNFDNHNDIRLLQFLPAAPNLPYFYWVFDPAAKQFKRVQALDKITSPVFNHDKKLISSSWRSGCCDHGQKIYQYINGSPVLIEETETVPDPKDDKKSVITVKKRVNGRMSLVKKTTEP